MNDEKIDLIKEFVHVQWLFHRYHQQNHTNHGPMGDPSRGQGRVLTILKMNPEISQKDLLYLLDMRPQSLGEILSKLEKSGYITRTPLETDRRVMNIKLSKEGMEAVSTAEKEFSFDEMFECLGEEEQKNLSGYLRRIIETLEAQIGDEQPQRSFDPRFEMGQNHPGSMPFEPHPGYMPFDHRPGMSRGQEEHPAQSQNEPDKE